MHTLQKLCNRSQTAQPPTHTCMSPQCAHRVTDLVHAIGGLDEGRRLVQRPHDLAAPSTPRDGLQQDHAVLSDDEPVAGDRLTPRRLELAGRVRANQPPDLLVHPNHALVTNKDRGETCEPQANPDEFEGCHCIKTTLAWTNLDEDDFLTKAAKEEVSPIPSPLQAQHRTANSNQW